VDHRRRDADLPHHRRATAANVGSAGAGWEYVNDGGATCRITHDIDDTFPVPGSDAIYFVSKYFGEVWFSANALSSDATVKPADAGNGFTGTRRLAGDPGNPNRQWAVSSDGSGGSYYERTIDGWSTSADWSIANPDRGNLTIAEGVDFNAGTVLAIGSAGMIVESIDGTNFFHDPAGGAVATQDWRSVSLASAAAAAIGGTAGKLIVSANANVTPDVAAPTGTIVGPSSVNVGAATASPPRSPTTSAARASTPRASRGPSPACRARRDRLPRSRSRAQASTRSG